MKRIGIILVFCTLWATDGFAVSRSSGASASSPMVRAGTTAQRVKTKTAQKNRTVRVATPQQRTVSRSATNTTVSSRYVTPRTTQSSRSATVARAAVSETRTGAEYEQCKDAYFACMDQFCQLKNDNFRRCSCSDRIENLQSAQNNLQQAVEQLNAFNENLDIVGKTAAQAAAMNTASDGELALTKDNSASKALLTAIMNSIRGTDSNVEHSALSDLNSIDLSFDSANSFGTSDMGQNIAAYNGVVLYSAVYPQCRDAVQSKCNNASLQRAVNAYLMAIEQDCNTVQTAITNKQKETQNAIRESSSMLDMARAENHKKHNSDDIATCLANVESAILSEEVCGSNYHKCLDNGEYIDVSTGAPISGVVDFYKLGTLLTFNSGRNNADQKLAQNPSNRIFVGNFEKRVKQFAEPALDKCYDDADTVWTDYLNKALLDIYYAQQSKVNEIKQGCFDFVSACYMNGSTAMTNAMQGLVAAQTTTLNPNVLELNKSLCADYIESCNNMFDGQIVKDYIDNRHETDSLTACRAVVKQCFDNYGGTNYENFYYPSSGLSSRGTAPDWFSLYECADSGCTTYKCSDGTYGTNCSEYAYKSECAKQLAEIDACNTTEMIEQAFGGFDYNPNANNIYSRYTYKNQNRVLRSTGIATEVYNQIIDILQTQCSTLDGSFMNIQNLALYSDTYNPQSFCEAMFNDSSRYKHLARAYSIGKIRNRYLTSAPDASTVTISTSLLGTITTNNSATLPISTTRNYFYENMCPRDYGNNVDVQSWGACLCWENGGRRSNDGTSTRCTTSFPVLPLVVYDISAIDSNTYSAQQSTVYGMNNSCDTIYVTEVENDNTPKTSAPFTLWPYEHNELSKNKLPSEQDWCTGNINDKNQVCPFGVQTTNEQCKECPFDWVVTNDKCCPNGYSYNTTSEKCEKAGEQDVDATDTTSTMMNTNFPDGE